MNTICIIPARGGSKRIPRKNIKPFYGRPIIEWAIKEAKASQCFDHIIVSTDDDEIARFGIYCGVLAQHRTEKNASDTAVLSDVIEEVLGRIADEIEYICCLLPTAVLVDGRHIRSALDVLIDNPDADEVMPIVKFGYPIERAVNLGQSGRVYLREPQHLNSLSNHLPEHYHDAGQFYWMRTERFLAQRKIILDNTIGYELPASEVQDIDTDEDWLLAEIKFGRRLYALKAVSR